LDQERWWLDLQWSGLPPLLEGDKAITPPACCLRDYVTKTGFRRAACVSGGIDSALCAAIAVDALGIDKCAALCCPIKFTAQVSLDDAAKPPRTWI